MCGVKIESTNSLNPQMGLYIPTTFVNNYRMHYFFLDRSRSHEKLQGKAGCVPKHTRRQQGREG